MRNIFKGSFTEDGTGSGNDIFEAGFRFLASEARKNMDRKASVDWGVIVEQSRSDF